MEILSYFLSFITIVVSTLAPFCKKMKNVLIFSAIGNLTAGISYLLVGGISGGILSILAIALLTINYTFTSKGKQIPKRLIAIYMVVLVALNLALFKAWYDILTIFTAITFVLCMSQKNVKLYRIIVLTNVAIWLLYDFLSGAYGNLAVHGIQIISTLISMIPKKQKKEAIL